MTVGAIIIPGPGAWGQTIGPDNSSITPHYVLQLKLGKPTGFVFGNSGRLISLENKNLSLPMRIEGHGSGPAAANVTKFPEVAATEGALHYLCTAQQPSDIKARHEHYLFVAPTDQTYISEFSLRLDREFTIVDTKRPDGGPNWCILRQWHQSTIAPLSPPIALHVVNGTSNVISWNIRWSSIAKPSRIEAVERGQCKIEPGQWLHFRILWHISPNENGRVTVFMSKQRLPKDITAADMLFNYNGPVGYAATTKPSGNAGEKSLGHPLNTIREQQGIYQGPHLSPESHHGICVANVAIYEQPSDKP
ncbi:MAG: heparin lyase I family protein [Verrucomicrobiota bacterium]